LKIHYFLIFDKMLTLFTKNYREFSVIENGSVIRTFCGAKLANKCLPGDSVAILDDGCRLLDRCIQPIIAGLLELNSKVRFGFSGRNVPIYLFIPFNEAYPPFIVGCSEKDTSVNRLALVKFEGVWDEGFPRGNLQRLLPVDADADTEVLFWTYTPLACEKYKGEMPPLADMAGRQALPMGTFHIDPPGCKDVDDVLTFDGEQHVIITIADVATTIPIGHPLDVRASKICQTFYQDGVPKHMFPSNLSETQMTLLDGVKPGLSLRVNLKTLACDWFESVVQVEKTYTYESIYENAELCDRLRDMASCLGLCDEDRLTTGDSHKWVEIAMKFYNIQAAKLLKATGRGLLRSHSAPDSEKLSAYTHIDPELGFLAYKSAKYVKSDTECVKHWGLGTEVYTHATSPIRRYADLLNQRALKRILFDRGYCEISVETIEQMNRVAVSAKQHDRDYVFMCAVKKAPTGSVDGRLLAIKDLGDGTIKLSLYIKSWGLIAKTFYKTVGSDLYTIISKDETFTMTLVIGKLYTLSYHTDMRVRSWKRRVILRLE
jgi:hypothetical protein